VIVNTFRNGVKNLKRAKPFLKADLKSYGITGKKMLPLQEIGLYALKSKAKI